MLQTWVSLVFGFASASKEEEHRETQFVLLLAIWVVLSYLEFSANRFQSIFICTSAQGYLARVDIQKQTQMG